jgi:uncharacterized membrane protein YqjE
MEAELARENKSLGELFADLTRDIVTLLRQEVALARAEMSEKAAQVGKNVGFLIAGGAVAYAGFLALIAALIICLAENTGLTWSGSALLVGIVVAGVGGFLVWKGLEALKHIDLAPRETLETIKEEQQWFHGPAR